MSSADPWVKTELGRTSENVLPRPGSLRRVISPLEQVGQAPADGQAQAGPLAGGPMRVVQPGELVEDPGLIGQVDAQAGILDVDAELVLVAFGGDADVTRGR